MDEGAIDEGAMDEGAMDEGAMDEDAPEADAPGAALGAALDGADELEPADDDPAAVLLLELQAAMVSARVAPVSATRAFLTNMLSPLNACGNDGTIGPTAG